MFQVDLYTLIPYVSATQLIIEKHSRTIIFLRAIYIINISAWKSIAKHFERDLIVNYVDKDKFAYELYFLRFYKCNIGIKLKYTEISSNMLQPYVELQLLNNRLFHGTV